MAIKSFADLATALFTEEEMAAAAAESDKVAEKAAAKKITVDDITGSEYARLTAELDTIKDEIEQKFNFYRSGDQKLMTKYIKSKGLDVVRITHNSNYNGWGTAVSTFVVAYPGSWVTASGTIYWG